MNNSHDSPLIIQESDNSGVALSRVAQTWKYVIVKDLKVHDKFL